LWPMSSEMEFFSPEGHVLIVTRQIAPRVSRTVTYVNGDIETAKITIHL